MPSSLTNAPGTFQSLRNDDFRPLLRQFVLVFFDDILYSPSEALHKYHLSKVLIVLLQHRLYANRKKCEFGRIQIDYLGHVISGTGVVANLSKIQAMVD